jgi:TonB-linked SusC/RagA family outer membrane protein
VIANDATLETVFRQIEKQSGLRFMYSVDAVDVAERVTVAFEKVALDDVLGSLLGKKGVEWVYREDVISLKSNIQNFKSEDTAKKAKNLIETIVGKVLDAKGAPVPGATVIKKGSRKGTKTDSYGGFSLSGVDINSILVITHIGFETKEVVVSSTIINIRLNQAAGLLDETVIVGYGTTTQRFNTGNVTSIKAEEIARNPVSDPLLSLQGKVPGMIITQTTGLTGGQINVQIRGQNSINSGTLPLFIVDGVPYQPTVAITTLGSYGALGSAISALNFLNPQDIESIDVLKDADATSIYGSRGANGVILITTKKGKSGDTRFDVNFGSGIQQLSRRRKLLNTPEYLAMRREAFQNDGESPTVENAPDLLMWDTTRNVDWQETLLGHTANYTDANASLSGGTNLIQYILGGNYHKETTIFPGDFSSSRMGSHFSIGGMSQNQRLRSSLTGNYTVTNTNFPGIDFSTEITLPPNAPTIFDSNGNLNWENSTWKNPYSQLLTNRFDAQTTNLVYNVDVSYRFFKNIILKANIGYNELRNNTFSADLIAGRPPAEQRSARASASYVNSKFMSWISEPQMSYFNSIGRSTFNILLGSTLLGNTSDGTFSYLSGILQDALVRFPGAATYSLIRGNGSKYRYQAIFSRIGYIFDDKYIVNLTVRRDGSSRFGPKEQLSNFWSVGLGWIFTQEKFLREHIPFIKYGKIRMSYGISGNDQVGDYQYLDRYGFVENVYQGEKGLRVIGLFNPYFEWEKTRKSELGLEMGLLNDKIYVTGSYYLNKSNNQLLSYSLPAMTGGSSILGNVPVTIHNSGLELVLTSHNLETKTFKWLTTANLSITKNKLLSDEMNLMGKSRIGRPLSAISLYTALGVNPETGEYQFADEEGKPAGPLEADGFSTFGTLAPSLFGGIQNSFSYKGLQLDVFFQYVKQKGKRGIYEPDWVPGMIRNQSNDVLDRWRKPGDISMSQRLSQNTSLANNYSIYLASTANYVDASFVRLKNISVSWQMPDKWKEKMRVRSSRIYLQAQNLLTITKYAGWDPETQSVTVIPPLRVVTVGIQITL